MTDFYATYKLAHGRMLQAIEGLSPEQLCWRPHEDALSAFEMVMHVCGGEMFFASRLAGMDMSESDRRIESCARDRVINDSPFPFSDAEASQELIAETVERTQSLVVPMLEDPDPWRDKQIETPLGPVDYAQGIFARIAQHPAYHQGQIWIYRNDPRFPRA